MASFRTVWNSNGKEIIIFIFRIWVCMKKSSMLLKVCSFSYKCVSVCPKKYWHFFVGRLLLPHRINGNCVRIVRNICRASKNIVSLLFVYKILKFLDHYSTQDNQRPLIRLMDVQPHSMRVQIKPKEFQPRLMVRKVSWLNQHVSVYFQCMILS